MSYLMKNLRIVLWLFFMGFIAPAWAETSSGASSKNSSPLKSNLLSPEIKNNSINELSASVFDSLTLANVVIHARKKHQRREIILEGVETIDKQIKGYVYPASVYQVISDEETRNRIRQKNTSKLFTSLDISAQFVYQLSKQCLENPGLDYRKIIGTPVEDKKKKLLSFVIQFGKCDPARVELSDVINIEGKYYFEGMTASSLEKKQSSVNQAKGIAFQYELAGLFKSGVAPVKSNGLWGLIDTKGAWLVAPKYTDAGRLQEGFLAVSQAQDKFAFMDTNGKLLTEFKFKKAHYFSEGLAGVKIAEKWGFIDKSGALKISANYENIRNFKKGFAPVKQNKKWGYINKQGKWLVKPIYDAAYSFTDDGFAVVVVKNKRGFINTKARFSIKPSYRRVQRFSEGIAPVSKKKDSWSFVDKNNKPLFSKQFSQVRIFSEEMTAVMNAEKQWGYIDRTGKLLVPYQFTKAYDFKDGLALIRKGDKRGFVNKQGNIVVPMIYEDAFRFSEGLAPVKKEGLWGYIPKP